jgi:hypothetical protein
MKKCPVCQRTFEDSLRFCQNDGTALVDDAPVDLFQSPATAKPADDEPLQIPDFDPMKTVVASTEEQSEVLSTPPAPSFGDLGSLPTPEPESFTPPPAPDTYMPPPIGQPESAPIPPPPSFAEPEQIYQPPPSPFDTPFSAPTQQMGGQMSGNIPDWNPPPAPVAQWENQGNFGANTPFQPPGAASGQNSTLAVISLICGILGLCCGPLGIAALITGWIAKNKADENPMQYGGRGLALAGMILGGISLALMVLGLILNMFGLLLNSAGRGGPF